LKKISFKYAFLKFAVIVFSSTIGLMVIVCNPGSNKNIPLNNSSSQNNDRCKELEKRMKESELYMSTSKALNPSSLNKSSVYKDQYNTECKNKQE
jgi:hypothetical protein